jgi:hypothetical protein
MNNTEREAAGMLDALKARGDVLEYWFERVTFKLADDCRYTPDFQVLRRDGTVEFVEIKGGFVREDARLKIKMAAESQPFRFTVWQKKNKTDGGGWTVWEVPSGTWVESEAA